MFSPCEISGTSIYIANSVAQCVTGVLNWLVSKYDWCQSRPPVNHHFDTFLKGDESEF